MNHELGLMEELLNGGLLPEEEQTLRQLAALQIQAHAFTLKLSPVDRQVFTLLLARWQQAFTDDEANFRCPTDSFELTTASVARVLRAEGPAVEQGLRNRQAPVARVALEGSRRERQRLSG